MSPRDLIETARRTLGDDPGAPRQSDLRRAVSTIYYALFHCLARNCADTLVGKTRKHRRESAWRQAYRALEHGYARSQCFRSDIRKFTWEIQYFADSFTDMQRKRHQADYDPAGRWSKSAVMEDLDSAADAIEEFEAAALADRRAFAVFVLLKSRSP